MKRIYRKNQNYVLRTYFTGCPDDDGTEFFCVIEDRHTGKHLQAFIGTMKEALERFESLSLAR